MKRLISFFLLTALLLTGCTQKEEAKPHVAAYENANALLAEGKYADAALIFESLNGYEESVLLCMYARAKDKLSKGEYAQAFRGFTALGDFRDSALSAVYADACLMALDSDAWTVMEGAETLDGIALYMDSAERAENARLNLYNRANSYMNAGEYGLAGSDFYALGEYKDSVLMNKYASALRLESYGVKNASSYLSAVDAFEALGDFKDSAERAANVLKSVYDEAQRLLSEGYPRSAESLYNMLAYPEEYNWTTKRKTAYLDSREMVLYSQIDYLASSDVGKDLVRAAERFEQMNGFRDTSDRAAALREQVYQAAVQHMDAAAYAQAEELFLLQDYKDSLSMAKYASASAIETDAENTPEYYIDAEKAFLAIGDFKDSAERAEAAKEKLYLSSVSVLESGNYSYAKYLFSLQNYKDSQNLWLYAGAMNDVQNAGGDPDRMLFAARTFEGLGEVLDSAQQAASIRDSIYEKALKALKAGNYDTAEALFSKQDYKDSKEMVSYTRAVYMEAIGNRIEAVNQFYALGDFNGSAEKADQILDAMLEEAKAYEDNHQYDLAHNIYASMGEYRNGADLSKYVLSEKALYEAGDDPARRIQAAVSFENLNSIFDSAQRAEAIRKEVYESAEKALTDKDYQEAAYLFSLQDYKDSQILCTYAGALSLETGSNETYELKIKAAEVFESIPQVRDSAERAKQIRTSLTELAHEKLNSGDYEQARDLFRLQPSWEQNALYAEYAEARFAEEEALTDPVNWIRAHRIYTANLAGQLDADERAEACIENAYVTAWECHEAKDFEKAVTLFALLGDYKESADAKQYAEATKTLHNALDNAKEYVKAKEMYASLGDYRDSKAAAEKIDKQLFVRFVDDIGVFTKDGLARFEKNGKWGYVSTSGEVIVNAKYDMAYDFSEGLAAVKLGDKWGYIDTKGNVVIQMKYEKARSFSDDMAAVYDRSGWKYITAKGKVVELPKYISNSDYIRYFENGYVFLGSDYESHSKKYVMNKEGEIVSYGNPLSFSEDIAVVSDQNGYRYRYMTIDGQYLSDTEWSKARPFENGRGIVKTDVGYGIVDKTGKYVSDPQWDEIQSATDGIFLVKKDGNYGYIDTNGKTVSPAQWNYAYPFTDSLALVWQNGYYGYIDTEGNTAIDFVYDEAQPFKDGFAFVKQYGAWKCIDTKGNTVFEIDERVSKVHGSAKENRILVSGSDAKYGYIDQEGNIVIDMTWGNASATFSEGLAYVSKYSDSSGGCFINEDGDIVINDAGNRISSFSNGVAIIYRYNYYLIDKAGRTITNRGYGDIARIGEDRFAVKDGSYYGVIDGNGATILPPINNYLTVSTETKNGKTVITGIFAENASLYNNGRNEFLSFPIDENGRALPMSGIDETGVFAIKQNGVWYFTDADGEIIF